MSRGSDFMFGVLVGGVLGFAAGLVVAPDKGEETVRSFRQQAQAVAEEFRDGAEEFSLKLKDGAEEIMHRAAQNAPSSEQVDKTLSEIEARLAELEEQLETES